MPNPICPFATLVRGADWHLNLSRLIDPQVGIVHTTQGNDSRALLANRHHNSPGTAHFLIRDGVLEQYYPINVKCSHAAGANGRGAAVAELEHFTGQPVDKRDLAMLGRLARWQNTEWGVPLDFRVGDARVIGQGQASSPRIWIDRSTYRGFLNHAGVDYPPDRSLLHYDGITVDEWRIAIGTAPRKKEISMFIADDPAHRQRLVDADGWKQEFTGKLITAFGISWREDASGYVAGGVEVRKMSKVDFDRIRQAPPVTGGTGGGLSVEAVEAAFSRVLDRTKLTPV